VLKRGLHHHPGRFAAKGTIVHRLALNIFIAVKDRREIDVAGPIKTLDQIDRGFDLVFLSTSWTYRKSGQSRKNGNAPRPIADAHQSSCFVHISCPNHGLQAKIWVRQFVPSS
jgi:hypothetical protein